MNIQYKIVKWQAVMAFTDTGFKKFRWIHDRQDQQQSKCVQKASISKWMAKGKINLIQKDPTKIKEHFPATIDR